MVFRCDSAAQYYLALAVMMLIFMLLPAPSDLRLIIESELFIIVCAMRCYTTREFQFTQKGCTIRFLWFQRFIPYSSFRAIRFVNYSLYPHNHRYPYKGVTLLSIREPKGINSIFQRIVPTNYSFLHIFSFVYVYSVPAPTQKQKRYFEYHAIETELPDLLNQWGVAVKTVQSSW